MNEASHTKVDLSRTSGLVSEGTHLFKITAAKEQLSGAGNAQYVLTATCQDQGEDLGRAVTLFMPLVPQARFRIDALLDAINAPRKGEWTCEQFVNKSFRGVVVTDQFEGSPTSKISKFLPAGMTSAPVKQTLSGGGSGLPKDSSKKPDELSF